MAQTGKGSKVDPGIQEKSRKRCTHETRVFCLDGVFLSAKGLFFGVPAVDVDFDQTSERKKAKRPIKSARLAASSVVGVRAF